RNSSRCTHHFPLTQTIRTVVSSWYFVYKCEVGLATAIMLRMKVSERNTINPHQNWNLGLLEKAIQPVLSPINPKGLWN
ncbi:4-diphosphocytidyl-2-C-methyl-D-erythritol kinase, partial [Frankliniella fusca]